MKKTTKILSIILALVMILSVIPMAAFAAVESGSVTDTVNYEFDRETAVLTISGTGDIPDAYDSLPYSYFQFKEVIIEDGITGIGVGAFQLSDTLEKVTIADSVKSISQGAFLACANLKSVVIPDGVTTIEDQTFDTCWALESVTIPDSVTKIGNQAFYDCKALKSITIPDSVESIGVAAFEKSALESVIIPDSVTTLGTSVFSSCANLESVTISDSTTGFGGMVFKDCTALTTVNYPCDSDVEAIKALMSTYGDFDYVMFHNFTDGVCPCGISEFAIDENGVLTGYNGEGGDVVIPDGVTAIDDQVFSMNASITSVVIPEGVTSIGDVAFIGCTNLTSVTLSAGLTSIGEAAFAGCGIESITIPDSVTEIGVEAFFECRNLKDVYVSWTDGIPRISEDAFTYMIDEEREVLGWTSAELHVPEGTEEAYENAECWFLFYLPKFNDPDFVINMYGFLVAYNGDGGDVVIPDGVVAIGNNVFDESMRLFPGVTSVKIPDTVFEIGDSAFCRCDGLETVTIPENVYRIGYDAFASCRNLESVTLPAGIEIIEDTAFSDCGSLKTVYYPCNTTRENVEDLMFTFGDFDYVQLDHNFVDGECTYCGSACDHNGQTSGVCEICGRNLADDFVIDENGVLVKYNGTGSSVVVPDGVTAIGENAFYNTKVKNVVIPEGVTSLDDSAFAYCAGLESVTLPESLKTIGDNAFNYCENVDLKIPAGVTSIGVQAFNHCRSIKEITVPDGVTELNEMALAGCGGITSLVIPDSVTKIGRASVFSCGGIKELTISGNAASIDEEAFRGSGSIENIYFSRAEDVFAISDDTFDADVYENATLHVPEGTKALYEAADGWSNFVNIVDDIEVTSELDKAKAAAIAELEAAAREDATGVTAAKLEEAIAAINAAESLDEIEAAEAAGSEALDSIPAGDVKEAVCEPTSDSNRTINAAVEDKAQKVQLINENGNTYTFTRDDPRVTIQGYDANGNPVDADSEDAVYEEWTVNQPLKEGTYTMIAKDKDGNWNTVENGCKISVEDSREYIDVISITPAVTTAGCNEKFDVQVVTGKDISKIAIQYNGHTYKTFAPSGKDADDNNVFDCFIASGIKGDNTITVQYKTADGWQECTDVSATVTIVENVL